MKALRVKPGVQFARIKPAGFRILSALQRCVLTLDIDLTITCGSEAHSPGNPHTLGEAFDVRSKTLAPHLKPVVLDAVLADLSDGPEDVPTPTSGGYGTRAFFGFLEAAGTPQEHFHFQRRRWQTYP